MSDRELRALERAAQSDPEAAEAYARARLRVDLDGVLTVRLSTPLRPSDIWTMRVFKAAGFNTPYAESVLDAAGEGTPIPECWSVQVPVGDYVVVWISTETQYQRQDVHVRGKVRLSLLTTPDRVGIRRSTQGDSA